MPNPINNLLDNDGYLITTEHWDKETANKIAELNHIALSSDHWFVINFLRHFYQEFPTIKTPAMRVMIKALKEHLGADKGTSIYFHQLFPYGLVQACKIAGLPKSGRCKKNVF